MNMADRIQYLRKSKGISQEELADKVGVSRQAVSKWESEQSTPDLEKIIIMSDFFGVTTDYILKGIEPVADKEQKNKELTEVTSGSIRSGKCTTIRYGRRNPVPFRLLTTYSP